LAKSECRGTRADEGADFRFQENYVAQADSLPALKAANSAPHANLNYMALSASFFGQRFNITERDLERYLDEALSRGGDYADLYFEYLATSNISMDESIVKSATQGVSLGIGVRVISGEDRKSTRLNSSHLGI